MILDNLNEIYQEVLEELSYRVGIVNLRNKNHVDILSEILDTTELAQYKSDILSELYKNVIAELDFQDKAAFADYKSQHKMRSDTPVTIAGKKTTVGAASDKSKEKKSEPTKSIEPEKVQLKKLNQEQETIKQSLNKGDFSQIIKSSNEINALRDIGIAGAGGPVASYGEARLTSTANEFNGEGYSNWKKSNKQKIDTEKENILANSKSYANRVKEISKQLGASTEEAIDYLAQRKVFGDLELERLKSNSQSLWYKGGNKGFGENEAAFRLWANADFDGAHATLYEVKTGSNIDVSKPFHVIQSNPKQDGSDVAIVSHLQDKLEEAKKSKNIDDVQHYEKEIRAFEKLGFHDTMVIGKDKNDRTTVLHITNKKANELNDMWANTTPEYMLGVIKKTFGTDVSQTVIKIADEGIDKCKDGKQATNRAFASIKLDDNFIKIAEHPKMSKYVDALRQHKAFNKYAETNNIDLQKVSTGELLLASQQYIRNEQSNGKEVAYVPFGKILTKVGELAQEGPFVRANPKIDFESSIIKRAIKNKNDEKDLVGAVHTDIVKSIGEADKEKGFPDKDGNNGPHTEAYIATVIHSMHFDLMVENFDNSLSAVTGIRGSRPGDFRGCLAKLSEYSGEIETPKGREELNKHLLKKCKINATTGFIEITNPNGNVSLAEDSWRTSGESKKVEKKLGKGLRECVASKVDGRKSSK